MGAILYPKVSCHYSFMATQRAQLKPVADHVNLLVEVYKSDTDRTTAGTSSNSFIRSFINTPLLHLHLT